MNAQDRRSTAVGSQVHALDGHAGLVEGVAVDPATLQASWLIVGLVTGARIAVPASSASVDTAGAVRLPFSNTRLAGTPQVESDVVDADLARAIAEHLDLLA